MLRVMKSGGTIYWYGTGSDPLQQSDLTGANVYAHYYFNGMRIARREPNGWIDHYGLDHLGNTRWVYGNNGVWDVSDYYPFGGERVISTAGSNHFKFTGKERDAESGLDNFGARYDSSSMGRFMSPDPLIASARLEDPQSWNRYSYALNNPLRFTDAEGLFASPAFNCTETNTNCLNDEQRRILNNSTGTDKNGNKVSGEALYNSLNEKQQNAFVNITDRLASIQLGDGTTALGQVQSITPDPKTGQFAPDRIFANVSNTLATAIQNSNEFTTVPAGLHAPFNAISFKDTGVTFGNIQFSFNQARTGADIDIDIGNVAAKNFLGRIIGGAVHAEEVVQNGLFNTRTNQDIVRRILINNPKVQTITPSPDPKFNRP